MNKVTNNNLQYLIIQYNNLCLKRNYNICKKI